MTDSVSTSEMSGPITARSMRKEKLSTVTASEPVRRESRSGFTVLPPAQVSGSNGDRFHRFHCQIVVSFVITCDI